MGECVARGAVARARRGRSTLSVVARPSGELRNAWMRGQAMARRRGGGRLLRLADPMPMALSPAHECDRQRRNRRDRYRPPPARGWPARTDPDRQPSRTTATKSGAVCERPGGPRDRDRRLRRLSLGTSLALGQVHATTTATYDAGLLFADGGLASPPAHRPALRAKRDRADAGSDPRANGCKAGWVAPIAGAMAPRRPRPARLRERRLLAGRAGPRRSRRTRAGASRRACVR